MLEKLRTPGRGAGPVGLIDIGTSKVCCIVAVPGPGGLRPAGLGHQRSRGVKAGVVVDLDLAEAAVRAAVGQAERMAGVAIDHALVSVACGRLKSSTFTASARIESGVVREAAIDRVMRGAREWAERDGRTLVHMNRIAFRLDGVGGIADPRGMAGAKLSADMHAITADESPLSNLQLLVDRCDITVRSLVATPYASAIAVTTADERRLGVTVLDIGGGTTSMAMFAQGHLLWADAMPVGANHLTFDLARDLGTPLAQAERIKAVYGTLVAAHSDEHEVVSYPQTGEDGAMHRTTKAAIRDVMRPRMVSMLSLVSERLARSPALAFSGGRVVLTGGGALMVGAAELAAEVLGRPVRIGRPSSAGLPASVSNPAFATAMGLFAVAASDDAGAAVLRDSEGLASGYLGRIGQWLRQGL